MSAGSPPIRRRGSRSGTGGGLPRQALALMLLVSLAFAAAVYMGSRHPYTDSTASPAQLSMMVVPLQPGAGGIPTGARVPTGTAAPTASASGSAAASASASASASAAAQDPGPYAGTAVEDYAIGGAGILLPFPHHTSDFSSDQVLRALKIVYNYLDASSLDPQVLSSAKGSTGVIRQMLAPGQRAQFDQSLSQPRDDQQHDATGWLVRFDPSKVRLVEPEGIRVSGKLHVEQLNSGTLEITSDFTFVYALSPAPAASSATPSPSPTVSPAASPSASLSAGSATGPAAGSGASANPSAAATEQPPIVLYTVRRAITYWFTADDLNAYQTELVESVVQAGPTSCDADNSAYLQPLFPTASATPAAPVSGKRPGAATAKATAAPEAAPTPGPSVDPFDQNRPAWDVCGVLSGPTLQHDLPQAGTG
ncbi:hypothetical protein [Streptacidiphilus sp. P02-A3a]|uniref:hypothetical protein n=1 Tax=Streptacidiphilus sp. P02-A3a TaxID=2704468 RepID=UPI0015F99E5A|nr:hypothetical protein [Streptacidiphilus sp. P02-A3a]QMU68162.1 hypothetical protein GXP74_07920 [Streptacidiphilus sp. P02-A3a]